MQDWQCRRRCWSRGICSDRLNTSAITCHGHFKHERAHNKIKAVVNYTHPRVECRVGRGDSLRCGMGESRSTRHTGFPQRNFLYFKFPFATCPVREKLGQPPEKARARCTIRLMQVPPLVAKSRLTLYYPSSARLKRRLGTMFPKGMCHGVLEYLWRLFDWHFRSAASSPERNPT